MQKEYYHMVKEDTLIQLVTDSLELDALKAGGVDNWEWSGASCEDDLNICAEEFNLERENLTFRDVAKHIVEKGFY